MSLINDALKRAKQAQKQSPATPASAPPFRPVETAPQANPNRGMLWYAALTVAAVCVVLFFWLALHRGNSHPASGTAANEGTVPSVPVKPASQPSAQTPPAASPVAARPAPPQPEVPAPTPAVKATTTSAPVQPVAQPVAPAVIAPAVTSGVTSVPAVTNEPPQPPPPPLPKLQGISYMPGRSAAMLNGKTVFVGDRAGEFRVVAIDRQSVTVVRAGKTNVLSLAE